MRFSLDKNEKHVIFRLQEPKLNTLIAAELKSELLILNTQGYNNVVLDLSESLYCDSSGLSAILVGNRLSRNSNGTFVLTGLSESVRKLIQISQLDQVLTISPTAAEAIAQIESQHVEEAVLRKVKNH